MQILDGKLISQTITQELTNKVSSFSSSPKLDIFLIGENSASEKYVSMKQKRAQEIGIDVNIHKYDKDISENTLVEEIEALNKNDSVHGIMVQVPLPNELNENKILNTISVEKDVDGLNAESLGKLFRKENPFVSATAKGIQTLIERYNINIEGKDVVVIGRSKEVGLPISALMLSKNATVTICHSHTTNLIDICKQSDVLISCMGQSKFITREFVKEGAIVIDVGFNIDPNTGKSVGDVDYENIKDLVSYITPVPGGVGPMTIVSLLENVVKAYEKQQS